MKLAGSTFFVDKLLLNLQLAELHLEIKEYDEVKSHCDDAIADLEREATSSKHPKLYAPFRATLAHRISILYGRMALSKGDINEAEARLIASAELGQSPSLGSFRPNLVLAGELFEKGEKECGLKYLFLCEKIWPAGKGRLRGWSATILRGEIPNFEL